MGFLLIIPIIILIKKLNDANQQIARMGGQPQPQPMPFIRSVSVPAKMTPMELEREAENLRHAAEAALRTQAETLLPRYEKSELVRDVVKLIGDSTKYGVLWDLDINDTAIDVTTMTDMIDSRMVYMKEHYDFTSMGFQDPEKESDHRLAFALALQKRLGMEYGIEYNFRFDPVKGVHVLSGLRIAYRKKEVQDTVDPGLRAPI